MAEVPATIRSARSQGRSRSKKGSSSAIQVCQKAIVASASPLTPDATSRAMPRRSASAKSDWTQQEASSQSVSSVREAPTPSMINTCTVSATSTAPSRP